MFFNYISAEDVHKRRLQGGILNENSLKFERKRNQSIIFSNAECFKSGEINIAFS